MCLSVATLAATYLFYTLKTKRGVRNTPKKRTRFRNPEILLEISGFLLGFQDFT